MPTFGPSVVAVDLVVAALVMTAVAVDKYRREASRTPRGIQLIRSGIAIAIVAISVCLLFSAFYNNPAWGNHLVGLAFFSGPGAWLCCELRGSNQGQSSSLGRPWVDGSEGTGGPRSGS
ncbi:MAG: hypothetical protein ACP5LG_08420, partial [Conexivisphaera sp.]